MKKKPIDLEKEFKTLKQGKKRKKMSDKRRKALAHARGIIKRLEKAGYDVNFGDVTQKGTRKLQNVSRQSLIMNGIAVEKAEKRAIREAVWHEKALQKQREREEKKAKNRATAAHLELEKIRKILKEGSDYYGEKSKRTNSIGKRISAYTEVNISSDSLTAIIDDAVSRLGEEEVVRRIKNYWKALTHFEELLNKLITAVYDDVYSVWGSGGREAYATDVAKIREVLDVSDKVGEIIGNEEDKNGDYDF